MSLAEFPTCGLSFSLKGPYDAALLTEFTAGRAALQTAVPTNSCECGNSIADLGYSQGLRTCVECSSQYPALQTAWGCDSCYAVNAPLYLYLGRVLPTADQIQQYLLNPGFAQKVDSNWTNAPQCSRGAAVKAACITNQSFSVNVPAAVTPTPSVNPAESDGGLSVAAIVGIVIGAVALVLVSLVIWTLPNKLERAVDRRPGISKWYTVFP